MQRMTKEEFWKNFNIGREVQLSGNFIYDGLLVFEQMENFCNEDEIFEFLYFISVGLERLLKANIVLLEHSDNQSQDDFEKSLITHNHSELLSRIYKNKEHNFGKVHIELIQVLTKFYKSFRYDRFSLVNYRSYDKEKNVLIAYLNKHLNINISCEFLEVTPNDNRLKKFVGKTIGKIVNQIYENIRNESYRLGIYTYEIRSLSKAYKIFLEQDFTFERERILQKEILIHLLKNEEESGSKEHINEHLPPLEFDNCMENTYVKCLFDVSRCGEFLDELEARYEELGDKKHRFAAIDVIGNEYIIFEKDMDDDFDYEEDE